jgi:hypothetical protein
MREEAKRGKKKIIKNKKSFRKEPKDGNDSSINIYEKTSLYR